MLVWSLTGAARYVSYLSSDLSLVTSVDETSPSTSLADGNYVFDGNGSVPTQGDIIDTGVSNAVVDSPIIEGSAIVIPNPPTLRVGSSVVVNPSIIAKGQVLTYIAGNDAHKAVVVISLIFSLFVVLLSLAGLAYCLFTKKNRGTVLILLCMALAPLILLVLPYGGRMIGRLYVVELVFAAYFIVRLFERHIKVAVVSLCLILFLACPFHVIAHYGNQEYDHISSDTIEGLHYFHDHANGGYITSLVYPWMIQDIEKYRYMRFENLRWYEDGVDCPYGDKDKDYWLYICDQERAFYELVCDAPDFVDEVEALIAQMPNMKLVYSNPDFQLYKIDMMARGQ
jgi:hypothetical protein